MRRIFLVPFLVAALSGFSSTWNHQGNLENQFYYYQGKKVVLQKTNITAILVEEGFDQRMIFDYAIPQESNQYTVKWILEQRIFLVTHNQPMNDYKLLMLRRSFEANYGVMVAAPVFAVGNEKLIVFDEIIVRFKKDKSNSDLGKLKDGSGNPVFAWPARKGPIPETWIYKVLYYPKFNPMYKVSRLTVLETANLYFESGLVEYAHPNFIRIQMR